MKYQDLKVKCFEKTSELIRNHEWITVNRILKESPKQLTNFSKIIEKEIIKEFINKDQIFIKGKKRYNLERALTICMELVVYDKSSFTSNLKKKICDKVFQRSEKINEDQIELFAKALGTDIIEEYGESISEHPRLVKFLINYYPENVHHFFPKFIEKEWWGLGFMLIQQYPPLLKKYKIEAAKVFQEHNYNYWQYKHMSEILKFNYSEFIDLMDQIRDERRNSFYKRLLRLSKNPKDIVWFQDHEQFFSVGVDLFTDSELKEIIDILLSLEVYRDHQNDNFRWINLCLIQIGWIKKKYLYEDNVETLLRLDYHQVIGDFFKEFPSKIRQFNKLFLENPKFYYYNLFKEYFNYFDIEDPVKEFRRWLRQEFPFSYLIGIFYHNRPRLEREFTRILEDYYNQIDFSNLPEEFSPFYGETILFKVTEGFYPKYSVSFYQKKIKEYLSDIRNIAFFNPYLSIHLANSFNLLDDNLQDHVFTILINRERLNTIARFLMINFSNFKKYIFRILSYEPKETSNVRIYIFLIQIIIRKTVEEKEIFSKCVEKLNSLEDSYEKAQLLSYLGHHKQALNSFQKISEKSLTIPSLIYELIDYKLEYVELNNHSFTLNDFSNLNTELLSILEDFREYNINKNRNTQFIFKENYYQSRLLLSNGILLLNYKNYDDAEECFTRAQENLRSINIPNIPQETGIILNTYEKIAALLIQLITIIKNNKKSDYMILNSILKKELNSIIEGLEIRDHKFGIIINQINLWAFKEDGILRQLECELPAPFCPKPPRINRKYIQIRDSTNIYEWNDKNLPKSYYAPIRIQNTWEPFKIIIEFADEEITFEYTLDIKHPSFIYKEIRETEFEKDKIIFNIHLRADNFSGRIEIELQIKPNDRCAVPLILKFPVEHQELIKKKADEITSGYNALDTEINSQLSELNFWAFNKTSSEIASVWGEVIENFLKILIKCYNYDTYFRKKAQKWKKEVNDMNPWMGGILSDHFQDRHRDHSSVAGGDADHWVDLIPIEDKLLRTEENLNADSVIEEKYLKHKEQILKEAGSSGFGVLVIADIRKEIIDGSLNPFPLKKCFKTFYENDIWIIVFLFQAFAKPPSK